MNPLQLARIFENVWIVEKGYVRGECERDEAAGAAGDCERP